MEIILLSENEKDIAEGFALSWFRKAESIVIYNNLDDLISIVLQKKGRKLECYGNNITREYNYKQPDSNPIVFEVN